MRERSRFLTAQPVGILSIPIMFGSDSSDGGDDLDRDVYHSHHHHHHQQQQQQQRHQRSSAGPRSNDPRSMSSREYHQPARDQNRLFRSSGSGAGSDISGIGTADSAGEERCLPAIAELYVHRSVSVSRDFLTCITPENGTDTIIYFIYIWGNFAPLVDFPVFERWFRVGTVHDQCFQTKTWFLEKLSISVTCSFIFKRSIGHLLP